MPSVEEVAAAEEALPGGYGRASGAEAESFEHRPGMVARKKGSVAAHGAQMYEQVTTRMRDRAPSTHNREMDTMPTRA